MLMLQLGVSTTLHLPLLLVLVTRKRQEHFKQVDLSSYKEDTLRYTAFALSA